MPDPLFIIAPGRSYTSLVGGMIGQHPDIYGLPEVNLSAVDTMGQLLQRLQGPFDFGLAGLLRLLAELHSGNQTEESVVEARQWLSERRHWTTRQMWEHLQEQIGDKIMLEKSPLNNFRIEHLNNLLEVFPNASFLHLTRHPGTAGKSSMALREQLRGEHGGGQPQKTRSMDPEQGWLRAQKNIMEFWHQLSVGQYMRVKAEMLLRDPQFYLGQICEWLGIRTDAEAIEAMLHPEASPYACMGPPSAKFGNDPNFLKNPVIDFDRLKKIKEPPLEDGAEWRGGDAFGKDTLKLARQFGYA
ncbi:sulfotransferase family protein [Pseudoroseicyclus sp. H15]